MHVDRAYAKNPLYDGTIIMLVAKLGNGSGIPLAIAHVPIKSKHPPPCLAVAFACKGWLAWMWRAFIGFLTEEISFWLPEFCFHNMGCYYQ
jgi:hypothetical protein